MDFAAITTLPTKQIYTFSEGVTATTDQGGRGSRL
jgi:hypothetical protein